MMRTSTARPRALSLVAPKWAKGVLRWRRARCLGALLGGPNDEARSGHRLWQKGLSECLWAAEVRNSSWIARLERENRVHHRHNADLFAGYRHFILMLKDSTFEVLAKSYQLHRWSREQVIVQFPGGRLA